MKKFPILISYRSGFQSHFDPVIGDYTEGLYTDLLVYATSITNMYKIMKEKKGIKKSFIKIKTIL